MGDHPHIADLRRRVEADPASIAFAQLAEEYRRAGLLEQAVAVCREGLSRYPSYLSARITLGRALTDLGRLDQAATELERALDLAPDNAVARRALDELRQRRPVSHAPVADDAPASGAALGQLERWLEAIRADRGRRQQSPDAAS